MTSSIRVRRDGVDFGLLPGQVLPVWDNISGCWKEAFKVRRTCATLRWDGTQRVVETPTGFRPKLGSPVPLEGPGFVKELGQHALLPVVGDGVQNGREWPSLDGDHIARWRAVRASDAEVVFWCRNHSVRLLAEDQWLIPALGAVTATEGEDSQPCRLVGQDKEGFFTPLLPIVVDGPSSFLGQNPEYQEQLLQRAWEIVSSHKPKKLWLGWVFAGDIEGLETSSVYPEAVPDALMPLPYGGEEWLLWWNATAPRWGDESLYQAVESITCISHVDDSFCGHRDREVAEAILRQEAVALQ